MESEWTLNPVMYGLTYQHGYEGVWKRPRVAAPFILGGNPCLLTNIPVAGHPERCVFYHVAGEQIESGPFATFKPDPSLNFPYGFDVG